jgi:hypothetical protein
MLFLPRRWSCSASFGGIRLERLWEDRVMSDRGDGEGTNLVQASKGAALAKLQRFLDKGELAQKRAVFLEALGEATDGDA